MNAVEVFALSVKLANELRAEGLPVMGCGHGGDHVEIAFRRQDGGLFWVEAPPEQATVASVRRLWARARAGLGRGEGGDPRAVWP